MGEGKMYQVAVRVVSQEGFCDCNHKVGDEWIIGKTTPAGVCLHALSDMYPYLWALMFGGSFPWESDPDIATGVACSDAKNPVVFELRRVRE